MSIEMQDSERRIHELIQTLKERDVEVENLKADLADRHAKIPQPGDGFQVRTIREIKDLQARVRTDEKSKKTEEREKKDIEKNGIAAEIIMGYINSTLKRHRAFKSKKMRYMIFINDLMLGLDAAIAGSVYAETIVSADIKTRIVECQQSVQEEMLGLCSWLESIPEQHNDNVVM